MSKIKGILIDVEEGLEAKRMEIIDSLDTYYEILKCSCIDIANRDIGGKRYDIVCDDEGLFKDAVYPSAIGRGKNVMLVGNIFIAGVADDEGELTSLTDDDVDNIMSHVKRAYNSERNVSWPVVLGMDY